MPDGALEIYSSESLRTAAQSSSSSNSSLDGLDASIEYLVKLNQACMSHLDTNFPTFCILLPFL